jgi:hypothetical protein
MLSVINWPMAPVAPKIRMWFGKEGVMVAF